MNDCDLQRLSVYLDDELAPPARAAVEAHVRACAGCAAELERLREFSRLLREARLDPITESELKRLHEAVDRERAAERSAWRLGLTLSGLAASVLVVSAAWLMESPAARPVSERAPILASIEPWERMAMTLRAEPVPAPDPELPVRFADATLADWMLDGLTKSSTP